MGLTPGGGRFPKTPEPRPQPGRAYFYSKLKIGGTFESDQSSYRRDPARLKIRRVKGSLDFEWPDASCVFIREIKNRGQMGYRWRGVLWIEERREQKNRDADPESERNKEVRGRKPNLDCKSRLHVKMARKPTRKSRFFATPLEW